MYGVKTASKNDRWDKLVMCYVWNLLINYQTVCTGAQHDAWYPETVLTNNLIAQE